VSNEFNTQTPNACCASVDVSRFQRCGLEFHTRHFGREMSQTKGSAKQARVDLRRPPDKAPSALFSGAPHQWRRTSVRRAGSEKASPVARRGNAVRWDGSGQRESVLDAAGLYQVAHQVLMHALDCVR
jgi:hypothetical protein